MTSPLHDLLVARPDAQHGLGADAAQIARAAHALGSPFPLDYTAFLARFGWAAVGPQEIFGLGADVPHRWMDVTPVTAQERIDGDLLQI